MRGVYTLIIDLKETLSFNLKSLGNLSFEKGTWIYIGSAMGNGSSNLLEISHLRKEHGFTLVLQWAMVPQVLKIASHDIFVLRKLSIGT